MQQSQRPYIPPTCGLSLLHDVASLPCGMQFPTHIINATNYRPNEHLYSSVHGLVLLVRKIHRDQQILLYVNLQKNHKSCRLRFQILLMTSSYNLPSLNQLAFSHSELIIRR